MNTQTINQGIRNKSTIKYIDTDSLQNGIKQFPYCQSLHLLYIKKLQIEKSSDFNQELAITAAFANDRKAMHNLLIEDEILIVEKFESENISISNLDSLKQEDEILLGVEAAAEYSIKNKVSDTGTSDIINFNKHDESDGLELIENEVEDEFRNEIQNQFMLSNEISGGGAETNHFHELLTEDEEEELVDEHTDAELESIKHLEDEMIEHDINEDLKVDEVNILSKAESSISEIEEEDNEMFEEKIIAPEILSNIEIESFNINVSSSKEEDNTLNLDEKSFINWLHSVSKNRNNIKPLIPQKETIINKTQEKIILNTENDSIAQTIIEPEKIIELDTIIQESLNANQYSTYQIPKEIIQEIKSIDDFVVETHQLKSIKKNYQEVTVAELAKRSLEEGEEIITESMARVLYAQGKQKRAIVEKLMLLYPDKRIYFAALIEKFKKQI